MSGRFPARPRMGLCGTQSSSAFLLHALHRGGVRWDAVITVPRALNRGITDWRDLRSDAAAVGAPCMDVASYGMGDDVTRRRILEFELECLVVVGWQRLIPTWFLDALPLGAFGMHGSALPLPYGRGRSPMNWSILEGRDRFLSHLIRYDAGADTGEVIDVQRFDIAPWDTIRSLQHKNTLSQVRLLERHLPRILAGQAIGRPQDRAAPATWYPKRSPADGVLDWTWTATELHRLVRAVAAPHPGAFTFDGAVQIEVHEASPFDTHLDFGGPPPGTVVAAFTDGTFVVQCLQDTLYVTRWNAAEGWTPREGARLRSMENRSKRLLRAMHAAAEDGSEGAE